MKIYTVDNKQNLSLSYSTASVLKTDICALHNADAIIIIYQEKKLNIQLKKQV